MKSRDDGTKRVVLSTPMVKSRKPCVPCAKARKFMPKPVRKRLEDLEQKMIARREKGQK